MLVMLSSFVPVHAVAGTAEGTLITNVACATYGAVQPNCDFVVSYCVTASVLVANPLIAANKSSNPTIECSGGTITFCIYVRNNSAYTSAFNILVSDILPQNISYINGGQANWAGGTAGAAITIGSGSFIPFTTAWVEAPAAQTSNYYLRWNISIMGPGKSALVCWKGNIL